MEFNKVVGNNILIFGDLHFSDVFTGKHKNYLANCFSVLNTLTQLIEEKQPSAIVLEGDIVGWLETNVREREVLSMFCKILRSWTDNGKRRIYAVKGNHDMKGYPEFLFLAELGIITTSAQCGGYFDFYAPDHDKAEVRFHIVDYKEEDRKLNLATDGVSNTVLGHNNYTIQGLTNWYSEHDGIELGMLQNFAGIDLVISGHIHNPSPDFVSATMSDGSECMLFYPGCPTRPIKDRNMYDSCWAVEIKYNAETNNTDILTLPVQLEPAADIFYSDEEFVDEKPEEVLQEELRKEALSEVLSDLLKYRISQANPLTQIDLIPNATEEAKATAKSYLMKALNTAV